MRPAKSLVVRFWIALATVWLFAIGTCALTVQAQRWERLLLPQAFQSAYLLDVFFLPGNPNFGWVSGMNGVVLRTSDAGSTWEGIVIPGAGQLESINFVNTSTGYVSGPQGIWKSTDGGRTFRELLTPGAGLEWGNFFVSADTGVVVGDGCGGTQYFHRTTNGGNSWTTFLGSRPSSGLSDVVLIPNTQSGFALSSGLIWRTSDGGLTWSVMATTNSPGWQEELAVFGPSFLVPVAGNTCAGNNAGGAVLFSMDNGNSWSQRLTPRVMYGSFLLSERKGWAVGSGSTALYTQDGGNTWDLHNCGVTGDLDDIWFVNDTTGYAVGDGIYRYSPAFRSISRTALHYGETCFPGETIDSAIVELLSFFGSDARLRITGTHASDFELLSPDTTFFVGGCDRVPIRIKFKPKEGGYRFADLRVELDNPPTIWNLPLTGQGTDVGSFTEDSVLVLDPAPCGVRTSDSIFYLTPSPSVERIFQVRQTGGDSSIGFAGNLPIELLPARGGHVPFTIVPVDTGWYAATFNVTVERCQNTVTVRARGVSPIIDVPSAKELLLTRCANEARDSVFVANRGNAPLIISSMRVDGEHATEFVIIGWRDGQPLIGRSIAPGKGEWLLMRFLPADRIGIRSAELILTCNDSTRKRGDRSRVNIGLTGKLASPLLSLAEKVIDFGDLCVGSWIDSSTYFRNFGTVAATLGTPVNADEPFANGFEKILPFELRPYDSTRITLRFAPRTSGQYIDTLVFGTSPCGDTFRLIVKGRAVQPGLVASPDFINEVIPIATETRKTITLRATNGDATLVSIQFDPPIPGLTISNGPSLPVYVPHDSDVTFELLVARGTDSALRTRLCFRTADTNKPSNRRGICASQVCVPISIERGAKSLSIDLNRLSFPPMKCQTRRDTMRLRLQARGYTDTLTMWRLINGQSGFRIVQPLASEPVLSDGETLELVVEHTPSGMPLDRDTLVIATKETEREQRLFVIPVERTFETTQTSIIERLLDFGTIDVCETSKTLWIRLRNQGLIYDTILFSPPDVNQGFVLVGPPAIVLAPGVTDSVRVDYNARSAQAPGQHFSVLKMRSVVCPFSDSARLKAIGTSGGLQISDLTVDFGTVTLTDRAERLFTVRNDGLTPRWMKVGTIDPDTNGFSVEPSDILVVQPGQSAQFRLSFNALLYGAKLSKLQLIDSGACSDTLTIPLQANVPLSVYPTIVVVDNHVAEYGKAVEIPVRVLTDFTDADVARIDLTFSYPESLLKIESITDNRDTGAVSIPFSFASNQVNLRLESAPERLLGQSGQLILVKGLALASLPDTGTITVSRFVVESRRPVKADVRSGLLRVTGPCMPINGLRLRPYLFASLRSELVEDRVQIDVRATTEISNVKATIFDFFGNPVVYSSGHALAPGQNVLEISVVDLAAGLYYLALTHPGQTWSSRFLIVP